MKQGTLVYILTGVVFMTAQALLMRLAPVRKLFGIPPIPKHLQGRSYSMLESIQHVKDSYRKKREEADREAMKRIGKR